jgi:serine phosphatase RsbU (regulator of sigma subunit)
MPYERPYATPDADGAARSVGEDDIWQLAAALSKTATPQDVARALAEHGGPAAGATFSNMAILDTETSRVQVVHRSIMDPRIADRWSEFDLSAPTPLCEAMRTQRAVLFGSVDRVGEHYPNLLADTRAASLSALASLPLISADGDVLGATGFGWPEDQEFTPSQEKRLNLIAQLTSEALERAALQVSQERLRVRERAESQLLQRAFLPKELPQSESLELAAVYLPARDAPMGGDWYDAFPVDGGICLVIGDVAGHGVDSAAVMAQLRNAVRAFADEDPSPARVLSRLNRMMCRLEPGATASAIVALWNESTGTILRSNAGHPPVLRCRSEEFGFLMSPGGLLLGVRPDQEYAEEAKVLRPGTTLLFYTDGLVETRDRSMDDSMADLLSFVEGLPDYSPKRICDEVLDWRLTAARQEDDMCLLAARLM